jgi:hypothetical protein
MNEQIYNKSPISKPSPKSEEKAAEPSAKTAAARASDTPASVWSSVKGDDRG